MSALGFVGGLGSFANSFMQGYEKSEDREQLKADREFQKQQRTYEQGQQQRKIDEQKRSDAQRDADAKIATTEEIDDPSWKPAPASENPVAQVTIGDDGTETVTPAQAPQQAPKITRQRQWDSIYRDYATNRKASGDTAGAIEFTDKANKISAQRSANAFLQVQAEAANKTPIQLAQEIGKIFDADPMNGGTKSIEPIEGGVRMTLFNKDTGQTSTKEFTGPDASKKLIDAFNPYFRPDAYAKVLDKRVETQDARTAELLKPYTLRPGEKRQVMGADGKVVTIGEGNLPKGYELATDDAGNTVMRPSATAGKSGGKAPKTAVEEAQDLLKDAQGGKGDGSPDGAARYGRAMSYLDGVFSGNPNVSPRMAVAIASDAAADPTKITLQLDNRTGQVSKVYRNPDFEGGRQFNLGANAGTIQEMEKQVGKSGMMESVTGMVGELSANVPPEQQGAFRTQLLKAATDPVARKAALDAARTNGQDVSAMTRQLDLIKTYAAPAPGPGKLDTNVGGMKGSPSKFNGLSGKALNDAVNADVQSQIEANRPNAARLSKARADAAADVDLKRLDAERANALRAGRAVDANAKIDEANKLRKERYGF